MSVELIATTIIAKAGEARSLAFLALNEAKNNNYELAKSKMKESNNSIKEALESQKELNQHLDHSLNLLLVHAEDHLMTTILAQELIQEIIILYEKMDILGRD